MQEKRGVTFATRGMCMAPFHRWAIGWREDYLRQGRDEGPIESEAVPITQFIWRDKGGVKWLKNRPECDELLQGASNEAWRLLWNVVRLDNQKDGWKKDRRKWNRKNKNKRVFEHVRNARETASSKVQVSIRRLTIWFTVYFIAIFHNYWIFPVLFYLFNFEI